MIVSIIMVQSSTIRPHMQELQNKVSREGVPTRTRSQKSDASHSRIETNLVSLSVSFSRLADQGLKVCKN